MVKANPAQTAAARRMVEQAANGRAAADYLFLEAWERDPVPGSGAALRVGQIRRANPAFAAELRAELDQRRPLTYAERVVLTRQLSH